MQAEGLNRVTDLLRVSGGEPSARVALAGQPSADGATCCHWLSTVRRMLPAAAPAPDPAPASSD